MTSLPNSAWLGFAILAIGHLPYTKLFQEVAGCACTVFEATKVVVFLFSRAIGYADKHDKHAGLEHGPTAESLKPNWRLSYHFSKPSYTLIHRGIVPDLKKNSNCKSGTETVTGGCAWCYFRT